MPKLWSHTDVKESPTSTLRHRDVTARSPTSKTTSGPTNSSINISPSYTATPVLVADTFVYCFNTSRGVLCLRVWVSNTTKVQDDFSVYRQSFGSRTFQTEPSVKHNCHFLVGHVVNRTRSTVAITACNENEMVRNVINPLKGSGVRRLHFEVFSAIQV